MPNITPKYQIPYPRPSEPVRDGASAMQAMAELSLIHI